MPKALLWFTLVQQHQAFYLYLGCGTSVKIIYFFFNILLFRAKLWVVGFFFLFPSFSTSLETEGTDCTELLEAVV